MHFCSLSNFSPFLLKCLIPSSFGWLCTVSLKPRTDGLVTLLYPQFIHYTPPHRKLLADLKEWIQTRPLLLSPPGPHCLEASEKCRTSRPTTDLQNLHFNKMPGVLKGAVSVRAMQLDSICQIRRKGSQVIMAATDVADALHTASSLHATRWTSK